MDTSRRRSTVSFQLASSRHFFRNASMRFFRSILSAISRVDRPIALRIVYPFHADMTRNARHCALSALARSCPERKWTFFLESSTHSFHFANARDIFESSTFDRRRSARSPLTRLAHAASVACAHELNARVSVDEVILATATAIFSRANARSSTQSRHASNENAAAREINLFANLLARASKRDARIASRHVSNAAATATRFKRLTATARILRSVRCTASASSLVRRVAVVHSRHHANPLRFAACFRRSRSAR